ncbi:MAG: efflux RND transporter permease subunit [Candidatus Omnitrophota bacterium]
MWEKIITYFARRHLLINFMFVAVFIGGVFAWQHTNKEEMPDITFDRVRITVRYPGAPAEDVEYFVTKPIEEELRGIDGVYRVTSTSSVGSSNISVELEPNYPNKDEAITEIRNGVLDVDLPDDVIDDPSVRVFKTSKKAIIDIALMYKDVHLLDVESRRILQKYAFSLENQLLNLSEVNSINKTGYLQEEIQIKVYPEKLREFNIPFNTVMQETKANHLRQPAGTIESPQEPKVTLLSELNTTEKLSNLVIQGGFEGRLIRLGEVADIRSAYEKNNEVMKINGHEGIILNVVKSSSYGILDAIDVVERVVEEFKKNNLEGTSIDLQLLDDESLDVRNRLSIVGMNAAIGFSLIILILFTFLTVQSGLWVAMGIPFTFCFTMICASFMGYTINNTTLAAVIIVMGMIVDDAIVVAENITRFSQQGMGREEAVVKGTTYVLLPIIASIVTTCVAFIPLFFFSGHFGKFVQFIPPIIFLMLGASLLESILILPGHMNFKLPFGNETSSRRTHWFQKIEDGYGWLLERLLPGKWIIFIFFLGLLVFSGSIAHTTMKFVMFPREETQNVSITGIVHDDAKRYDTARLTTQVEDVLTPYIGKEVIGFRTDIARSRRGGAVEENRFHIQVEIVPKEKRKKSADALIKEWNAAFEGLNGFNKLTIQKSHWGQESGTPIEILVQENKDPVRAALVAELAAAMKDHAALTNVEIEEGLRVPEYKVDIDHDKIKRLSINPADIASTFRAALEGTVLYDFSNGYEDIDVRFTIIDEAKGDINKVLSLPVENKGDYLVPLGDIVRVSEVVSPNAIERQDLKRTTMLDAAIKKGAGKTPLEIAADFETRIFPRLVSRFPTAVMSFAGEVKDTRESKSDLTNAITLAVFLIYIILAVLFNSLVKPLIIMLAIPFGVVGIIIAFWLHGKTLFGFYAAIGALGLAGVVVNDSIIMLVKLEKEYDRAHDAHDANHQIAQIAKTRLRAIILTTITTVAGVLPTAYGFAGYDAMLAEMMLALAWGLMFGTVITLILIPCVYSLGKKRRLQTA